MADKHPFAGMPVIRRTVNKRGGWVEFYDPNALSFSGTGAAVMAPDGKVPKDDNIRQMLQVAANLIVGWDAADHISGEALPIPAGDADVADRATAAYVNAVVEAWMEMQKGPEADPNLPAPSTE